MFVRLGTDGCHARWRTGVLYVPILCARANGCWKIPRMSMHSVCVNRFTLPVLICSPLWYRHQPPYPLKSPFFHLRYSRHICQIFNSFYPPISFCTFLVASFHRSTLQNSVCFIISPHASYICGSILVVSYLKCIYNTFVLRCLKFSPMHES